MPAVFLQSPSRRCHLPVSLCASHMCCKIPLKCCLHQELLLTSQLRGVSPPSLCLCPPLSLSLSLNATFRTTFLSFKVFMTFWLLFICTYTIKTNKQNTILSRLPMNVEKYFGYLLKPSELISLMCLHIVAAQ